MNAERLREFLLTLPHVVEAKQWGGLLYWVGDKAIGGKTFLHMNVEAGAGHPAMFPVGAECFSEMCERDGMISAPYLARGFWVAAERWNALRDAEWREELTAAHALTFDKLPARTKAVMAMPAGERKKLVAERKKLLAARKAAKK